MAATDDGERSGRVEGAGTRQQGDSATASVDEVFVFFAFFGSRAHAHGTVLGLKSHGHTFRKVVGNQSRNANTEIDNIAVVQFLGCAFSDHFSHFIFFHNVDI